MVHCFAQANYADQGLTDMIAHLHCSCTFLHRGRSSKLSTHAIATSNGQVSLVQPYSHFFLQRNLPRLFLISLDTCFLLVRLKSHLHNSLIPIANRCCCKERLRCRVLNQSSGGWPVLSNGNRCVLLPSIGICKFSKCLFFYCQLFCGNGRVDWTTCPHLLHSINVPCSLCQ